MNSTLKFAATAVIATLAISAPVSASVINGTCGTVSGPTELNLASVACTKFDSNLGPLNSMSLTITGSISGMLTLVNNGSTTQTGMATTSSSFLADALPGFSFPSPLFTASFGTGAQPIPAGATFTFAGLNSGTLSSGPMVNNSILAPYQQAGGGSFSVLISTLTGLQAFGGGGQFGFGQSTSAAASATVSYEYGLVTAVPEPAPLAILGLGMLALGIVRRRR